MYLYLILAAGAVFCAAKAIGAKRLLGSALWLAGTSAIVAALLYLMEAYEVAVIELSVGAGLVTILFVFAISIAGEEGIKARPTMPRWLAWSAIIAALLLLGRLALPLYEGGRSFEPPFGLVLWQMRGLDVLLQVLLILAGVVSALGLLAESKASQAAGHAAEGAAALKYTTRPAAGEVRR